MSTGETQRPERLSRHGGREGDIWNGPPSEGTREGASEADGEGMGRVSPRLPSPGPASPSTHWKPQGRDKDYSSLQPQTTQLGPELHHQRRTGETGVKEGPR